MKQENISHSLSKEIAKKYVKQVFPGDMELDFNYMLVENFAIKDQGALNETTSTEFYQFAAIEVAKNKCYCIVQPDSCMIQQWGALPDNCFFGMKQTLEINFLHHPISKKNLILCDNITDTLCLLFLGIPAIVVNSKTVWDNAYFNKIIKPTFPNLIAMFPTENIPPGYKSDIKIFDPKPLFKEEEDSDSFFIYCLGAHRETDFLAPLWDLYEYIDDDNLIIEDEPIIIN
jgi:hypothetical protein